MANGARYKVQTRYGWFSLDEGSYRDYLAGKLCWINWPPEPSAPSQQKQEPLPPDVTPQALQLRDEAAKKGVCEVLQQFGNLPHTPYKNRLQDVPIYELSLTVRASNGLMRAGTQTFAALDRLIRSEGGISRVRNLGAKSVKEIRDAFFTECYHRLLPYEKAEFWQEVLDSAQSRLSDIS